MNNTLYLFLLLGYNIPVVTLFYELKKMKYQIKMRKQSFLFIIFFAICSLSQSQNIQVTYHTDYTGNAARPEKIKSEQTRLIISKESSEFYSPFRARVDSLMAAMEKRGVPFAEFQKEKSRIPDGNIQFRIYKNYPQIGVLTFTDRIIPSDYKYVEPLEKPQWKLEKETKEILNYKCQKATTKFRGRLWIAWYTSDIPIQDGPWKLWGLPGLILEAEDCDSLYRFVAIGLERKEEEAIFIPEKQYINCTRDQYLKQKNIFEQNPMAAISKGKGEVVMTNEKGDVLKPKNREYINIEIDGEK